MGRCRASSGEALEIRERAIPKGDWGFSDAKRLMADTLIRQEKFAEAELFLLEADEEFRADPAASSIAGATVPDRTRADGRIVREVGKARAGCRLARSCRRPSRRRAGPATRTAAASRPPPRPVHRSERAVGTGLPNISDATKVSTTHSLRANQGASHERVGQTTISLTSTRPSAGEPSPHQQRFPLLMLILGFLGKNSWAVR